MRRRVATSVAVFATAIVALVIAAPAFAVVGLPAALLVNLLAERFPGVYGYG